jgi:hypothetical protein
MFIAPPKGCDLFGSQYLRFKIVSTVSALVVLQNSHLLAPVSENAAATSTQSADSPKFTLPQEMGRRSSSPRVGYSVCAVSKADREVGFGISGLAA